MNAPDFSQSSEALLAELDDSIPQGVPNDTGMRRRADDPATTDSQLDSLDALLAESVEVAEAAKQHKADLESRKRGYVGMSQEEVDYCNSRMHAFEMARVWEPQWAIGVWWSFECQNELCNAQPRLVFSRYMEYHQHRHNKTANRWLTVLSTAMEATPVKETRYVPVCPRCSEWDMDPRNLTDLSDALG